MMLAHLLNSVAGP